MTGSPNGFLTDLFCQKRSKRTCFCVGSNPPCSPPCSIGIFCRRLLASLLVCLRTTGTVEHCEEENMPPCRAEDNNHYKTNERIPHPLEPLSADEVTKAVQIVKRDRGLGITYRFHCVTLQEPPKTQVLAYEACAGGDEEETAVLDREAFLILLDNATGKAYEAVANLTKDCVRTWTELSGVHPNIVPDELEECEKLVKADPDFLAALEKRGLLDDLDNVVVDPWAIGHFGFPDEEGIRMTKCICYHRNSPGGNFYSRPIDGLMPVVDLNKMVVLRVEDLGVVPVPPEAGEYAREFHHKTFRQDVKPLEILQPQGPSFQVDGHLIRWQKWQIRVGFTPREGLVLYNVGYEDDRRLRSVLYRASMAEMVVPYGDPRPQHYRKNAFGMYPLF